MNWHAVFEHVVGPAPNDVLVVADCNAAASAAHVTPSWAGEKTLLAATTEDGVVGGHAFSHQLARELERGRATGGFTAADLHWRLLHAHARGELLGRPELRLLSRGADPSITLAPLPQDEMLGGEEQHDNGLVDGFAALMCEGESDGDEEEDEDEGNEPAE